MKTMECVNPGPKPIGRVKPPSFSAAKIINYFLSPNKTLKNIMNINDFKRKIQQKQAEFTKAIHRTLPIKIGRKAADHFQDNFRKGGFAVRHPPSRSRWQPRQDPCHLLPRPPLFPKRLQPLRLLQAQHQVPTPLHLQSTSQRLLQLSLHQWVYRQSFR